jgi:hypothetical protein
MSFGSWRGYAIGLPSGWAVEADDRFLVARPHTDSAFTPNLVLTAQAPADFADPGAGLPGSVLLGHGRVARPFAADELLFGYPLGAAAVTVWQLSGAPPGGEPLVATFSADAADFARYRPVVEAALATVEVLP